MQENVTKYLFQLKHCISIRATNSVCTVEALQFLKYKNLKYEPRLSVSQETLLQAQSDDKYTV